MTTINQLPPATNPQPADLIPVQTASGTTEAYTPANVAAAMGIGRAAYLPAGGANGAVVADAFGNLSPQAFVSQGTTTARTFAVRGADSVNVADFGAKLDGVTNDIASLQAARNVAPANGTVFVPSGNLAVVSWPQIPSGASPVLWSLSGNLINGQNSYLFAGPDVVETFFNGKWIYRTATAGTEQPLLRLDNTITHTGGNGGGLVLQANTTVDATANPGFVPVGVSFNFNFNPTAIGTPSAIGFFAAQTRGLGVSSDLYGMNFEVIDQGNSPNEYNALIACEWDIVANGTSVNAQWGGLTFTAAKYASNGAPCIPQFAYDATTTQADLTQGGWINAYQAHGTNIYSAAYDASDATIQSGAAAFKMSAGQPIEFNGIYSTNADAPAPKNQLLWNPTAKNLEYQVAGTAVFSITDAGQLSLENGYNINGASTINALSGSSAGVLLTLSAPSDPNGAGLMLVGNGNTTSSKTIRVQNGFFQILNSDYSATIFQIDDSGNVNNVQSLTVSSPAIAPDQVPQWTQVQTWVTANFQPKT